MRSLTYWIKPALALALLACLVLLWQHPTVQALSSLEGVQNQWVRLQALAQSPWALPAMFALSALAVVISFPQMVLITITTLLFSPWAALGTTLLGCTAGAAITFALGRWFFRDALLHLIEKKQRMDLLIALERGGFRYVLGLRVAFFMFFALNWLPGATNIRMRDYLAATFLGAIPWVGVLVLLVEKLQTGETTALAWLALPAALVVFTMLLRKRLGANAAQSLKNDELVGK